MHKTLFLSFWLIGCGGSSVSQYCDRAAECSNDDCSLSEEACAVVQKGDEQECEAVLDTIRNVVASGEAPECDACVEAMDLFYDCAAEVPTCSDFDDAASEDCDGEYDEYREACPSSVQSSCSRETDGSDCEDALARLNAAVADCGVGSSSSSTSTSTSYGPTDYCLPQFTPVYICYAECYEDADCGALDGSDLDAATDLLACIGSCPSLSETTYSY
jgi:hypothetical protein